MGAVKLAVWLPHPGMADMLSLVAEFEMGVRWLIEDMMEVASSYLSECQISKAEFSRSAVIAAVRRGGEVTISKTRRNPQGVPVKVVCSMKLSVSSHE